jgi:Protein of unknown function (DUF3551)
MRSILLTAASIGVACLLSGGGAAAQSEWCSVARDGDGENCRFTTYEQCRTNGIDGWCIRNSQAAPAPAAGPATAQIEVPAAPAPAPAPAARRRPELRPAAAVRSAPNIVPPKPAANTATRLLNPALLAPQPEFNCEFDTASLGASPPQQPTLASTQAGPAPAATDVARIKADYERQCYRHAEIISLDRLRHLQASADETIKALRREPAGTKISLPDRALLAPASGFDCEFKTASVDNASTQSQPAAAGAQTGAGGDAALRAKLDYELQCYRHATLILRDRIQHLQASLGETIKAVNRGKPLAAQSRRGGSSSN